MPASDWVPQVDDVAAILRARTKDDAGNELGTFNELTRPTAEQVETLIGAAQAELTAVFGSAEINVPYRDLFNQLATYNAAMKVEIGYYPEQVNTARSPYAVLYQAYRDLLADVRKVTDVIVDDGNPATYGPTSPAWAFGTYPRVIGMRTPL